MQGRDLGEIAERCVTGDSSTRTSESKGAEPLEMVVSAVASYRPAWMLRDGAKLRRTRAALLRLLAPFTDRQDGVDANLSMAVALLADEVSRLRVRVAELERGIREADLTR